jgi:hypothetical protein
MPDVTPKLTEAQVDAALPGRREDGHVPLAIVTALLRTVEAKGGHDG